MIKNFLHSILKAHEIPFNSKNNILQKFTINASNSFVAFMKPQHVVWYYYVYETDGNFSSKSNDFQKNLIFPLMYM